MNSKFRGLLLLALVAALATSRGALADVFDFSSTTQALTGTAPTLSTQGMPLRRGKERAQGFRVTATADSGQTITGGALRCYFFGQVTSRWARCPDFDITLATGGRDAVSVDFEPLVGYGRIHYVPDAVTVSGGTTVVVTLEVSYESP